MVRRVPYEYNPVPTKIVASLISWHNWLGVKARSGVRRSKISPFPQKLAVYTSFFLASRIAQILLDVGIACSANASKVSIFTKGFEVARSRPFNMLAPTLRPVKDPGPVVKQIKL